MVQAKNRIDRNRVRRVLFAWHYVAGLTDPTIKMMNKASVLLARNLRRRVLLEWFAYVQEESYRDEWKRREAWCKSLQHRQRGAHHRMVKLFRHARMIRVVGAWKRWSSGKNLKRQKMAIAAAHFKKNSQFKVLWAMRDYREDRIQRKNLRTKLENKCRSILLSHLVVEWQEQAARLANKRVLEAKAVAHRRRRVLAISLERLCAVVDTSRFRRALLRKFQKSRLAACFRAWIEVQSTSAYNDLIVARFVARRTRRTLQKCFYAFCDQIVETINVEQGTDVEALERKIRELEEKNRKLEVENNRYGKFVDTADLGRGRMKQLSEAVSNLQVSLDFLVGGNIASWRGLKSDRFLPLSLSCALALSLRTREASSRTWSA